MSEITPNTPNPVREDAYVEELSEKLGIEPQYIPKSPVWRNEEEIRAIAEMFANMSGSSGGGVLVVHEVEGTMDKTWQEIHDALLTGGAIVLRADGQDAYCDIVFSATKSPDESSFDVVCGSIVPPGNAGAWPYSASSASGYPFYTE